MAAGFCMQCGRPLAPGAQFCASCGSPVAAASAPVSQSPPAGLPPPPPPPPPPPGPPLGVVLGLQGIRSFLVQHQFLGNGHSYRVLTPEKRHLFTAQENLAAEMGANMAGLSLGLGQLLQNRTFAWTVNDATGAARGSIAFQISGYHSLSTLTDPAGAPLLVVNVDRGIMGKLTATAGGPDGRPIFQVQGNLIHHNFAIVDPSGREVAKIHEAWASVRDTYALDLVQPVDPLGPLIFAILIDREKNRQ